MPIKRQKKNEVAVRPGDRGEIISKRPFDLWSDMDRLFDEFRTGFDDLFWPFSRRHGLMEYTSQRTPSLDVADMGNHYEMYVEMPGIPKDNVNIEVTPNKIEIKAECEEGSEDKKKNWLRRECSNIGYYRALEFPEEIQTDTVEAELQNGILSIRLPKVEPSPEHKVKKVKIK
jgi:HSP20 family protein